MNKESRIVELESLIKKNAELYYNGMSEISDEQFDFFVEELKQLDPNNTLFTTTGWGYVPSKREVKHRVKVSGIPNKQFIDPEARLDCPYEGINIILPKLDGGSVELIYEEGKFKQAITRGNGEVGTDCTRVLKYLIPLDLGCNATCSILGEFLLSYENQEKYYKDEIAIRNIPNGFLQRLEVTEEECKRFTFIPYKICDISWDALNKLDHTLTYNDIVLFLKKWGFIAISYQRVSPYYWWSDCFEILSNIKGVGKVPCDGLVIRPEKLYYDVSDSPNRLIINYSTECAKKANIETAEVEVTGIVWDHTRTGKLVPVIQFTPTELSGAVLRNVTAFNAGYVRDNKIGIGSIIKICRSGLIIPYVLEVIKQVEPDIPKVCPRCGKEYQWSKTNVDLYDVNEDCPLNLYNKLYRWVSYFTVKGAAGNLLDKMIDYAHWLSVEDIYDNRVNEEYWNGLKVYEGMGLSNIKLAKQVYESLMKPKKLSEIINALNIQGLGYNNALKLANEGTLRLALENHDTKLLDSINIQGIGSSLINKLKDNFDYIQNIYDRLCLIGIEKEGECLIKEENKSDLIPVCVTGKLEIGTRSQFFDKFKDKIYESDIKNAKYLVTNTPDSGSSKNKKALQLGVQVISEQQFNELFK